MGNINKAKLIEVGNDVSALATLMQVVTGQLAEFATLPADLYAISCSTFLAGVLAGLNGDGPSPQFPLSKTALLLVGSDLVARFKESYASNIDACAETMQKMGANNVDQLLNNPALIGQLAKATQLNTIKGSKFGEYGVNAAAIAGGAVQGTKAVAAENVFRAGRVLGDLGRSYLPTAGLASTAAMLYSLKELTKAQNSIIKFSSKLMKETMGVAIAAASAGFFDGFSPVARDASLPRPNLGAVTRAVLENGARSVCNFWSNCYKEQKSKIQKLHSKMDVDSTVVAERGATMNKIADRTVGHVLGREFGTAQSIRDTITAASNASRSAIAYAVYNSVYTCAKIATETIVSQFKTTALALQQAQDPEKKVAKPERAWVTLDAVRTLERPGVESLLVKQLGMNDRDDLRQTLHSQIARHFTINMPIKELARHNNTMQGFFRNLQSDLRGLEYSTAFKLLRQMRDAAVDEGVDATAQREVLTHLTATMKKCTNGSEARALLDRSLSSMWLDLNQCQRQVNEQVELLANLKDTESDLLHKIEANGLQSNAGLFSRLYAGLSNLFNHSSEELVAVQQQIMQLESKFTYVSPRSAYLHSQVDNMHKTPTKDELITALTIVEQVSTDSPIFLTRMQELRESGIAANQSAKPKISLRNQSLGSDGELQSAASEHAAKIDGLDNARPAQTPPLQPVRSRAV